MTASPYSLFSHPDFDHHERVLFFRDPDTGVKGIIAVHNTNLGPSLGGCRMWGYSSEQDAIRDALRLSRGMTYKAALANLSLGGGKAVVMANPKTEKTPGILKALAQAVNDLSGKYITAEDVGTSVTDMQTIREYTPYVVGLPVRPDQDDGDPSHYTAYGIYQGMLAAIQHRLKATSVHGLTVAVQGLGSVGYKVCRHLHEDGAHLIVSDIDADNLAKAKQDFNAKVVAPEEIYSVKADVFSPNALGGILNNETIPTLQASVVTGGANNQLLTPENAEMLSRRNILYAPDYVVSAGGLIKVTYEDREFTREAVLAHVQKIHGTLLEVFREADEQNILPHQAADKIAERRFHKEAC